MFSCPRARSARHKYLFTNIYQMSLIWAFWERAPKQTQFSLKKEDQLISILYTRVFVEEYRWRIWAVSSRPIIFVGGMVASKKYVKRGKTLKKCRRSRKLRQSIFVISRMTGHNFVAAASLFPIFCRFEFYEMPAHFATRRGKLFLNARQDKS